MYWVWPRNFFKHYLVHPTSSFSFFLCILVGVGLGILAMRYAKGVIIIGTSILGGVLAGVSIAKIGGLEQFPYGVGMAVGIALLGMLIQFAINKDHYDDDDEEDEDDDEPEEEMRRSGKKKKFAQDRENVSEYNGANRRRNSSDRYSDARNDTGERKGNRSCSRNGDSDRRNSSGNRSESRRKEEIPEAQIETARQITAAEHQQQVLQEEAEMEETVLLKAAEKSEPQRSENSYSQNRRNTRSAGKSYYDDGDDYDASRERFDPDYRETPDTYEDFEKSQQRKRQLDIENMADFEDDEFEQLRNHEDSKNNRDLLRNLEPDDYDEWEDN